MVAYSVIGFSALFVGSFLLARRIYKRREIQDMEEEIKEEPRLHEGNDDYNCVVCMNNERNLVL